MDLQPLIEQIIEENHTRPEGCRDMVIRLLVAHENTPAHHLARAFELAAEATARMFEREGAPVVQTQLFRSMAGKLRSDIAIIGADATGAGLLCHWTETGDFMLGD